MYLVSFGLPVFDEEQSAPGWMIAWHTAWFSVVGTWELLINRAGEPLDFNDLPLACYSGFLANLLVLTTALLHRKLVVSPRVLVGCLAGAVGSALLTPVWATTIDIAVGSRIRTGFNLDLMKIREYFSDLSSGYWCWLGSMLVALLAAILPCRNVRRRNIASAAGE
jgi:hypothetical protein